MYNPVATRLLETSPGTNCSQFRVFSFDRTQGARRKSTIKSFEPSDVAIRRKNVPEAFYVSGTTENQSRSTPGMRLKPNCS